MKMPRISHSETPRLTAITKAALTSSISDPITNVSEMRKATVFTRQSKRLNVSAPTRIAVITGSCTRPLSASASKRP